jgi:hypothetical protein
MHASTAEEESVGEAIAATAAAAALEDTARSVDVADDDGLVDLTAEVDTAQTNEQQENEDVDASLLDSDESDDEFPVEANERDVEVDEEAFIAKAFKDKAASFPKMHGLKAPAGHDRSLSSDHKSNLHHFNDYSCFKVVAPAAAFFLSEASSGFFDFGLQYVYLTSNRHRKHGIGLESMCAGVRDWECRRSIVFFAERKV